MNAPFTLPGYITHCHVEFVISWQYHKGGRYNASARIFADGYDAIVFIPAAGAAHYCSLSIVEGGPDVEEKNRKSGLAESRPPVRLAGRAPER